MTTVSEDIDRLYLTHLLGTRVAAWLEESATAGRPTVIASMSRSEDGDPLGAGAGAGAEVEKVLPLFLSPGFTPQSAGRIVVSAEARETLRQIARRALQRSGLAFERPPS